MDGYNTTPADETATGMNDFKTEDEEARAYNVTRTVKTVEGLNFRVEPDRPIQKIAGVYRPIDLDSYIAMKFDKLNKKVDDIYAALQKRIDELSEKIDTLSKDVEDLKKAKTAKNASSQNETATTTP